MRGRRIMVGWHLRSRQALLLLDAALLMYSVPLAVHGGQHPQHCQHTPSLPPPSHPLVYLLHLPMYPCQCSLCASHLLCEQYSKHEPSRESIELALDTILQVRRAADCWAVWHERLHGKTAAGATCQPPCMPAGCAAAGCCCSVALPLSPTPTSPLLLFCRTSLRPLCNLHIPPSPPLPQVLQEKMKVRHRDGFRPPRSGRRTDVEGDAPNQRCVSFEGRRRPGCGLAWQALRGCRLAYTAKHAHLPTNPFTSPHWPSCSLWQRVRSYFEPSVHSSTLVNDGSIYIALGIWAAWTAAASDPTLPLGATLAFAAWKLYDKRVKRSPGEGGRWLAAASVLVVGALLQLRRCLCCGDGSGCGCGGCCVDADGVAGERAVPAADLAPPPPFPLPFPADGPFWGGNAMWGALFGIVAALVVGSIFSYVLVNVRVP